MSPVSIKGMKLGQHLDDKIEGLDVHVDIPDKTDQ